jgi:UDP-N-acetyl-D-mannosaminuronic acid dehydrogenase
MSLLPDTYRDRVVCIIGLGYVGLTLAVAMAEVGFKVIGIEVREDVVGELRRGEPHFHEPGMPEALRRITSNGSFEVYPSIPQSCEPDVYVITVGTPLDANGQVRLDMVRNASEQVAAKLKPGVMVVMRSTVRLGVTRSLVLPILEGTGKSFALAFCPERTVEGQALTELRWLPQIVGGYDYDSTVRAAQFFQFITPTVVKVSTLEVAETIKMIDNVQRDVMFGFSNEVARVCDAAGVNASEVIKAGKLGYPRTNLFMPGPVGGPCLSKDPYILIEGLRTFGVVPEITQAARAGNERQLVEAAEYVGRIVREHCLPTESPTIALLGLAFKGRPATDDLRGTTAKPVFDRLKELFPNATFKGFDPMVKAADIRAFGLEPCSDLPAAFAGSHAVVLLNNHPLLSTMPISDLAETMARPSFIYDLWSNFSAPELTLPGGVGYAALGCHVDAVLPGKSAASEMAVAKR